MRVGLLSLIALLLFATAAAKDKDKRPVLPTDVLRAHAVMVVIAPDASEPLNDPQANARAQDEVEKAFMKWERFQVVSEPSIADLIVTVRRGTGKAVSPTIRGGPIDQRPVILQPTDGSVRIGGHTGRPTDASGQDPSDAHPHTGTEYGPAEDTMEIYRCKRTVSEALEGIPVWRYTAKDSLKAPKLTEVEQFRKALDESEKAEASKTKNP